MVNGEPGGITMNSFQVLVDSDAFVAWLMPDDIFYQQVTEIFQRLEEEKVRLVTTSWVIAETATVLSNRVGQKLARQFLDQAEHIGLPIIHITEEIQREATRFFKDQEVRGTSMVDCGNAIVATRFGIPSVFSFDRFYKRLNLKTVS